MNKQKLWREYNLFISRKAKQHEPAIYKALRDQVKYYAETRQIDSIPIQPMYNAIRNLWVDVGRLWGWKTYSGILKDARVKPAQIKAAPIGWNAEFVQTILQLINAELLETVAKINDKTRDWILKSINDGLAAGNGIDQIVNSILTNTDIPRMRAERIARTESGKAANAAEQIGTDKTGLQTNKEWISVNDHRTRHDHREVDGQVQPDGQPFTVGAYKMQRPGDSKTQNAVGIVAPASEVVNCRCVIGRAVLRDKKTGLPLRRANNLPVLS